jgi:hypothetical protein
MKEINFNSQNIEKEKIKVIVSEKLKLICDNTGEGNIVIFVKDKIICDVIVSIKDKFKK